MARAGPASSPPLDPITDDRGSGLVEHPAPKFSIAAMSTGESAMLQPNRPSHQGAAGSSTAETFVYHVLGASLGQLVQVGNASSPPGRLQSAKGHGLGICPAQFGQFLGQLDRQRSPARQVGGGRASRPTSCKHSGRAGARAAQGTGRCRWPTSSTPTGRGLRPLKARRPAARRQQRRRASESAVPLNRIPLHGRRRAASDRSGSRRSMVEVLEVVTGESAGSIVWAGRAHRAGCGGSRCWARSSPDQR